MKVFIKNKPYNFDSGYNPYMPSENGWKKQNQDAFKISNIGNTLVFIKRFDKPVDKIPGYNFLCKTQNKITPFLPITYDLVSVTEENRKVTYLFQEALKGKTFEEYILKGEKITINPHCLMRNIHSAFQYIIKQDFWYTDFVPKNIFVAENGNFYLIDLDSVATLKILPNTDCSELSNVDRRYKIAVSTHGYRNIFNYDYTIIRDNLKGDTINFLELFIFLGQCHYFLDSNCRANFLDPNMINCVPEYLMRKNPTYTEAIFKSCFSYSDHAIHQQILNIHLINNYLQRVLFPNTEKIIMDFSRL